MMTLCPQADKDAIIANVLDTVDCHIRIAHDSYRELVGSNAWLAVALAGMLTVSVALIGYRLVTGRGLRLMDVTTVAFRIALVFAFMTLWAAHQAAAFDFLLDGPTKLVALLPNFSFDGNVLGEVQTAFARMTTAAGVYGDMASPTGNVLQDGAMLASGALWLAAMLLLLITLGLVIAAKIGLAFLLAIGPICIGLFLFDATRSLFHGWLRAAATFALAPLAANLLGAAMLLILAPFLGVLVKNVGQQTVDIGPVMTISLVVVAFALLIVLGIRAVALIGQGESGGARRWQDLLPERLATAEGNSAVA